MHRRLLSERGGVVAALLAQARCLTAHGIGDQLRSVLGDHAATRGRICESGSRPDRWCGWWPCHYGSRGGTGATCGADAVSRGRDRRRPCSNARGCRRRTWFHRAADPTREQPSPLLQHSRRVASRACPDRLCHLLQQARREGAKVLIRVHDRLGLEDVAHADVGAVKGALSQAL